MLPFALLWNLRDKILNTEQMQWLFHRIPQIAELTDPDLFC
jgi:hypothetical protein